MQKNIKLNINTYMYVLILLQPLIDITNYFSKVSIGLYLRFIPLILLLIYSFRKKIVSMKILIYFSLISILITSTLIYNYNVFNTLNSSYDIIAKIFFFPVLLIFFLDQDPSSGLLTAFQKGLLNSYDIILIIFILATVTNTYSHPYGSIEFGNKAWFHSGNEIGSTLAIYFPFLFYEFVEKKDVKSFIRLTTIFYPIVLLGVKTPIFSIILTIFIYLVIEFNAGTLRSKFKTMILFIVAIPSGIFLITKSSIYDVFLYRADSIFRGSNIITKLTSGRDYLVLKEYKVLQQYQPISYFLGIGSGINTVEMDLISIFFTIGVIGLFLFLLPSFFWLLDNKRNIFREKIPKNLKYTTPVLIGFLVAFFSGHTLVAPGVSIYIIFFMKATSIQGYTTEDTNENYINYKSVP